MVLFWTQYFGSKIFLLHHRGEYSITVFSNHNNVTYTIFDVNSRKNIENFSMDVFWFQNPTSKISVVYYCGENDLYGLFQKDHVTYTTFDVDSRENIDEIP